ncbi:hypothetical protein LWP59_31495 [Amycolatopsis acidiphila]|uniref:Uncharacterized protein n=1 Tax=Amycolatopsis acidiphila TaxID=715473 RepID=A0A558AH65_9PSEU|nr:hypothetical protein [Amycolatopsis acidiphila]TVT23604.1 hypothetical protein FNH06_08815 [Amycolatopsis acidiphila]UIJ58589.1 hypothetical protein LWP59_31495 [Amycolatopsis acidiphila]GHG76635.1 hypothetical protein GCM10017788_42280 [Amycolatopsis acidiphila]
MLEADGGFWAQALNGEASQAAYTVWGSDGMVGAPVAEAGGSGGFEFPSVEEMNTVLGLWKDRRASITQKKNQIVSAMAGLTQLADDQDSQGYLQQARDSLNLLKNQHDSMLSFIGDYITKLTDATNAKHSDEEGNVAALKSKSEN